MQPKDEAWIGTGDWVVYNDGFGKEEIGRVKHVGVSVKWVVYHCSGDWANYGDYTAAATPVEHLRPVTNDEIRKVLNQ